MPTRPCRTPAIPRRSFLAGATAATLLAACGGGDTSDAADAADAADQPQSVDDFLLLQPGFADGFRAPSMLAAGTTVRAPFFLYGGNGLPAVNGIPDVLAADLTLPGGETIAVDLQQRGAGVPTPYYVLSVDAAAEGDYQLHATVNGERQRADFRVAPAADIDLVQVGDRLRPVATPTVDDSHGYDPICTRFEPCPFHTVDLAQAIGNGRPKALLVATPGYCQTSICGPSVELLMELDPAPAIDVVHGEVYTEPGRADELGGFTELVGPIATTYGMIFEPSFVVADADDIVRARLDFTFDRAEMAEALALVG